MITLLLDIKNLNVSLQVGDLIFTTNTKIIGDAIDLQGTSSSGAAQELTSNNLIGVLKKITMEPNNKVELQVSNIGSLPLSVVDELSDQFVMFSKNNQTMGDVLGYYAKAKFVNNSKKKAEIFSVGSQVIINSK